VVWGSEPQSPLKGQLLYMMTFCFAFYESCLSTVQTGGGGGGRWAMGGWDEWRLENKETPILALPDLEQRTCLPFKQNYL
jgi:hypothetical protein